MFEEETHMRRGVLAWGLAGGDELLVPERAIPPGGKGMARKRFCLGFFAPNLASQVAAEGIPTTVAIPVGTDALGKKVVKRLQARGIQVEAVRIPGTVTASAVIIAEAGDRMIYKAARST